MEFGASDTQYIAYGAAKRNFAGEAQTSAGSA
jgi:hypothetical protein